MIETALPPVDKRAAHLANLFAELDALRASVQEEAAALLDQWGSWIRRPAFRAAALNLACHLALRRRDLNALQEELNRFGLATLTRNATSVLESLAAVSALLACAANLPWDQQPTPPSRGDLAAGLSRLTEESTRVFGPVSPGRQTRLMLTLPSDAPDDRTYMQRLVSRDIEVVRINSAQGNVTHWRQLLAALREAEAQSGHPRKTKVLFDLAGPSLHTTLFDGGSDRQRFAIGDSFWLARAPSDVPPGTPCFGCSLPEVIGQLHFDDPVWIADGELGGRVAERRHGAVRIAVTHAPEDGKRIKAGKGLRFPATELAVPALTPQDVAALTAFGAEADIIGYPFVQGAEDVVRLHDTLSSLGLRKLNAPALMMRIETRRALSNLPEIIAASAGQNPTAILIARGDLAIEIGHLRLGEAQEDIFALCEAASVPVVWAAPIFKALARHGSPTRGDLSDALAGVRAECILLNKGEHAPAATDTLIALLAQKMGHPRPRGGRMHALQSWQALFAD